MKHFGLLFSSNEKKITYSMKKILSSTYLGQLGLGKKPHGNPPPPLILTGNKHLRN